MIKNIIILTLFVLAVNSFSQTYPHGFVYLDDTAIIRLHDYVGEIQWQKTHEINNPGSWQNISAANADSLLVIADTTTFFRAEVIAGNCEPFYSDTSMVIIHPVDQAISQIGIPDDKPIDINGDVQYDFEIKYDLGIITGDWPPSGINISRFINPLNNNKFLFEGLEPPYGSPYLEHGDTIKNQYNINSTWVSAPAGVLHANIVLIDYNHNEGIYEYEIYENNWHINYGLSSESDFYLGFKLISGGTEKIGWMLLDINTENGEITIIDSEITSEDEIIIE